MKPEQDRTVWINGSGTVSCAGLTPQELFESALQNRSGIDGGLGRVTPELLMRMKERMQGSPFRSIFEDLFLSLPRSKAVLMPFYALCQAIESAGALNLSPDDGIILATTTGQISLWEPELVRFLNREISSAEFEKTSKHQRLGTLLDTLVDLFSFKGRTLLISSACSASTQAIAVGSSWVNLGLVKRCFVGGTEILCDLTVEGFKSLQLLSHEPSAPFDANRTGINLSEGSAFVCLERAPGLRPIGRVLGSGLSTDSYHMTAPQPEGAGSLRAMQAALEMAKLKPSDIPWVHAHGTGSKHNDLAEGHAIATLFGENLPFVTSTKWVHGHALGASGVLETVLCLEALKAKTILATGGLKNPDTQIKIKHPSNHIQLKQDDRTSLKMLKNTLGFGGINAALVIGDANAGASS